MHAVFFKSETIRIDGLEDLTIHVFEDEQAADEFVFDNLLKAGHISVCNERFVVGEESFDSKQDAIYEAQFSFGVTEFFHVYEAIDHRTAATEEHEPGDA